MNLSSPSLFELHEQVQKLDQRVQQVEQLLRLKASVETPVAVAPPTPKIEVLKPVTPPIAAPIDCNWPSRFSTPSVPPQAVSPAPEIATTTNSTSFSLGEWEHLIGGKWALWIGSLCLFLAMASFLAYTWAALPPPPPWAKVAFGMGVGAALLVAGEWLRSRAQRYFCEGLSGAGLSIGYLSLWAGAQHFTVFSPSIGFVGMAMLTALGVALAVRHDALSLSVLSTIGGFLTPILLRSHGGSASAVPFLSYLALLNAGVLAAALMKGWRGLIWLSFAATTLLLIGWAPDAHLSAHPWPSFHFFSLYFLLFLGAACFHSLARDEETAPEDLLLLFADTSLYALAGFALMQPLSGAFPAAFPLGLGLFFGLMTLGVAKLAPRNQSLCSAAAGLALLALTVAVPLQFHGAALTFGWTGEAATLLVLSGRLRSAMLRRAGQIVWALSGFPLLIDLAAATPNHPSFWGGGATSLLFCSIIAGFLAWNARHRAAKHADLDEMELVYAAFSLMGGAWFLGQEIYRFIALREAISSLQSSCVASFALAVGLGFYALLAFVLGLKWRHETVRGGALLIVFAATFIAVETAFASIPLGWTPGWNLRFAAWIAVIVVLSRLGRFLKNRTDALTDFEAQTAPGWMVGTALYALAGASLEVGLSFGRAAIPLDWHSHPIPIFALSMLWNGAAALLLWLGFRWREASLRTGAASIGGCAVAAMLWCAAWSISSGAYLQEWRIGAFATALLTIAASDALLRRNQRELNDWEVPLKSQLRFLALGLLLWSLTQESYAFCRASEAVLGTHWQRWAQMTISLIWSLFGSICLIGGIHRRYQPLRLVALGLLSVTVVKVFLFDLSFLSGPARMVSLAGLGAALIFISWLYSRFGTEKPVTSAPDSASRAGAETAAGTL